MNNCSVSGGVVTVQEPQQLVFSDEVHREVVAYCGTHGVGRVTVVSDANTFAIAGADIQRALQTARVSVTAIILEGNDLVSDERTVVSVMVGMSPETHLFIAVGAGTITDIVRFVAHRAGKPFLAVPTAPSADGFGAGNARLALQGFKQNVVCRSPAAVLVSRPVLSNAPEALLLAGFGDVLGKLSALADWELSHVLLDTPFDEELVQSLRRRCHRVLERGAEIFRRDPHALEELFRCLVVSGQAVQGSGSHDPAIGAERVLSQMLEMYHLHHGTSAIPHGILVARGAMYAARWYRQVRRWERSDIAERVITLPDHDSESRHLVLFLREAGQRLLERNSFLSTLTPSVIELIRARLVQRWERVQKIARQVPSPEDLREIIETAVPQGAATLQNANSDDRRDGDGGAPEQTAAQLCHLAHAGFTVRTLLFVLGEPPDID